MSPVNSTPKRARGGRREQNQANGVPKIVLLDTSVILNEADAFNSFEEHDVAIPTTVLKELDHLAPIALSADHHRLRAALHEPPPALAKPHKQVGASVTVDIEKSEVVRIDVDPSWLRQRPRVDQIGARVFE